MFLKEEQMKKALVLTMVLVAGLVLVAFAGPFVQIDLTLPDEGTAFIGFEAGDLLWRLRAVHRLGTPGLGLNVALYQDLKDGVIGVEYGLWIDDIDFVIAWPIPTVDNFGGSFAGVLHLGDIFALLDTEETESDALGLYVEKTEGNTLDIYAGVRLTYDADTGQLVPEFRLGFLWGSNVGMLANDYWRQIP